MQRYIVKILEYPSDSFRIEKLYYRTLREEIGEMIPKTIFFSGKIGTVDEEYPEYNRRIGAIMRYVQADAFLGDVFESDDIGIIPLSQTGINLTEEDKKAIFQLLRKFLDGADRALERTGIIVDPQNTNIRFVRSSDKSWRLYYIDSFKLYDLYVTQEDGAISTKELKRLKECFDNPHEVNDRGFITSLALRMNRLYRDGIRPLSDMVNEKLQNLP